MKAIVQDRYGSADVLQLEDVDKPEPAEDRVLVKVRAASVNALDWHFMTGEPWMVRMGALSRPSQRVRGVDLAGVVDAVGKQVNGIKPGDEVFGNGVGTFAEFATARPDQLVAKPGRLTFEQAAAIPVAGFTALQGLRDKGQVKPGQRVAVNGAGGGVGTFAVQIAKALGAHVTAVTSTGNLDLVRSLGPDEVVDYDREDFLRAGQRYDVIFDLGGNRSFAEIRRALGPGGTLVQAGAAKGPVMRLLKAVLLTRFVSQRLVAFISSPNQADLVTLKELAEAGKIAPAIGSRFPLAQAAEAVRQMTDGNARGKIVITIGE
jgi:NADPH:quinone reductase-like Zn-dependent oxidoreductase